MAKLNRVRIINFYYNNDIRQIADETFSFFGGENALLNLANGGGKSVLIQLMLQPVIPDYSIQKRTMSSYFKKNTQPAYILLEWILDNRAKKDYFMTGIAIAPKITNDENANNRLNYFTFASHYSEACELDLGYVPFSKREAGRQIILPFEKARESVRNLAGKNSEIFYYSREDAAGYKNKLSEFRISQEEWKNIIAKMNNDEGGIDELFEKCSTSNKLIDEWIIKTVEKAVIVTDTENTQVYELMEGLVNSTISNEEHIRNRKNLTCYLTDHMQLEKSLERVCDKLEINDMAKNDLNHLFRLLKIESSGLEADLFELQYRKDELEEQLSLINMEEKSEEYYNCLERYNGLKEAEDEISALKDKIKEQIENLKRDADIQTAAKKYVKCQELQGEINSLLLKLDKQQNDGGEEQRRINDLKFTLGLSYRQQSDRLGKELLDIGSKIEDLSEKITQSEQNIEDNQRKQNEIAGKIGTLENQISEFESFQEKVEIGLNVSFSRNLLGILDEKELSGIREDLDGLYKSSARTLEILQARMEEIKIIQTHNQTEKEELIEEIAAFNNDEKDKKNQRNEYIEKEKICREILKKYELPGEILFEHEEAGRRIGVLIQEREKRCSVFEIESSQIQEMISGIKSGQVYFPKSLTEILEREKVTYQTGEMYLNELPDDKRQIQLNKNPLLPFGIIVDKIGLAKVGKIKFEDAFLRQIIPVFTYADLRNEFSQENSLIIMNGGLRVISSYEPQLFDDAERKNYLLRIEENKNDIEERINNVKQELSFLRINANILNDFIYENDYFDKLEQELQTITNVRKDKELRRADIENENQALENEHKEKLHQLEETKQTLELQKQNIELFKKFLEKDKNYTNNIGIYSELIVSRDNLKKQFTIEKEKSKSYHNEQKDVITKQFQLKQELDHTNSRFLIYEAVKTGQKIEGSIDLLEKEYQSLSSGLEQSMKALEGELAEKKDSLKNYEDDISELNLASEDYKNVKFNEAELKIIKGRISESSETFEDLRDKWQKVHDEVTGAGARMNTAFLELQKMGMSQPLPKDEIKQDYVNRRKKIKFIKEEIKEKEKASQDRRQLCDIKIGIIGNLIIPEVPKNSLSRFELENDIEKQCKKLQTAYNEAIKNCEEEKKSYLKIYDHIRKNYDNVHVSITDILNSLVTLDINSEVSFEKVYFYAEELMKKRESLEKLLNLYEQQLAKMEDTKRQVTEQCVSYAALILEGIRAISEKSKIKLTGKTRPTQMLNIGIPKELDHNAAVYRMKEYIESTLKLLIDYLKNADNNNDSSKDKKYKEKIHSMVSTRQLLNQLIGKELIPVSIYKIELNENNSGMKSWEDAMKENSGGEKFVCFFTVASTLISYTREATSRRINESSIDESKVMIMDNPFARTSSEHLLKAVIDIARTFNIQLICLSDLSQSSITNRFNLIYTLSVRQKMYSDKEMLHIENIQKNKDGMFENERLEHAVLHQTFEQGNLFEFMDE